MEGAGPATHGAGAAGRPFSFPLVGEVDARSKTVAELNKTGERRLTKYISDAVVTISVQEIKGNKIFVLGQVNKPGEFIVNPSVNIMQALSMAGGMTPFAARTTSSCCAAGDAAEGDGVPLQRRRPRAKPRYQHRAAEWRYRCRAVKRRGAWLRRNSSVRSILFAALAADNACAENWEVAPRVLAGYRYSDNYHLGPPGTEVEVSGAEGEAGVTFRTLDPRTQIEITPSVLGTYFGSDSDDDSVDDYLDASFIDNSPRRRMGVTGLISRENVTRSELPEGGDSGGDLGSPSEGDSGRFVEHNDRTLVRISPFFSYDVSQRQVVDLTAHYVSADFENQLEGAQVDWTDAGVEAGWGYKVSERSTFSLHGLASRYETVFDTDAYGAYVQWDTKFTETSRVYVRVGAQQTEPENGERDTNLLAGIGGSWKRCATAVPRPDPDHPACGGGNCSGALPVAYAD